MPDGSKLPGEGKKTSGLISIGSRISLDRDDGDVAQNELVHVIPVRVRSSARGRSPAHELATFRSSGCRGECGISYESPPVYLSATAGLPVSHDGVLGAMRAASQIIPNATIPAIPRDIPIRLSSFRFSSRCHPPRYATMPASPTKPVADRITQSNAGEYRLPNRWARLTVPRMRRAEQHAAAGPPGHPDAVAP